MASASQAVYRVAKSSYGSLNPPQRKIDEPRAKWGRFDAAGYRTVYGAMPPTAAYAETLAAQKLALGVKDTILTDLFDMDRGGAKTLLEQVQEEWDQRHHMPPGTVAQGWRMDRLLYTLTLPPSGWFVALETSESMASIGRELGEKLAGCGVQTLTLSVLTGEDREATTTIGEWVRSQTLDDGSLPHGIVYSSKHGADWRCWAVWLRRIDDGMDATSELTKSDEGLEISAIHQNSALAEVAARFNLKIY